MAEENGSETNTRAKKGIWRRSFDRTLLAFALIAIAAGCAVYVIHGEQAFLNSTRESWHLLMFILPRVGAAVLIAAFLQILAPREIIARLIGEEAGIWSILIATLAGIFTPGGPLTSFPIVVALYTSGANKGALVAYISSWAMVGMQRILVWEWPLMGTHFTLIRTGASILLPILAGAIALYLPIRPRIADISES